MCGRYWRRAAGERAAVEGRENGRGARRGGGRRAAAAGTGGRARRRCRRAAAGGWTRLGVRVRWRRATGAAASGSPRPVMGPRSEVVWTGSGGAGYYTSEPRRDDVSVTLERRHGHDAPPGHQDAVRPPCACARASADARACAGAVRLPDAPAASVPRGRSCLPAIEGAAWPRHGRRCHSGAAAAKIGPFFEQARPCAPRRCCRYARSHPPPPCQKINRLRKAPQDRLSRSQQLASSFYRRKGILLAEHLVKCRVLF